MKFCSSLCAWVAQGLLLILACSCSLQVGVNRDNNLAQQLAPTLQAVVSTLCSESSEGGEYPVPSQYAQENRTIICTKDVNAMVASWGLGIRPFSLETENCPLAIHPVLQHLCGLESVYIASIECFQSGPNTSCRLIIEPSTLCDPRTGICPVQAPQADVTYIEETIRNYLQSSIGFSFQSLRGLVMVESMGMIEQSVVVGAETKKQDDISIFVMRRP